MALATYTTHDIPGFDHADRIRRSYLASMAGIEAPHTLDNPITAWCNFWNSPGLWNDDGTPSKTMRLTGELRRRGLNR